MANDLDERPQGEWLENLPQDELDELLAKQPDDPFIKQEYRNRGIDPDTGEPILQ